MINRSKIKKTILLSFVLLFLIGFGVLGYGALEYHNWTKTKEAIAGGGFTNLIAGTLGAVIPTCSYSQSGCTCNLCNDCGCNSFIQAMITMPQAVNKQITNLCVSTALQTKGTPITAASGKQFMAGSMTGKCLTGNAVLATPSIAASNFERLIGFVNDYIIAGFREK